MESDDRRLKTCLATSARGAFWRADRTGFQQIERVLPEEMPVSIEVNGETAAVTIATPADYVDLAYGFVLSEGIATNATAIENCLVYDQDDGVRVDMRVDQNSFCAQSRRQRTTIARSSCGLCGLAQLGDAIRALPEVAPGGALSPEILHQGILEMARRQPLNEQTHAVHAAAHIDSLGVFTEIREDIGRHNALDKLIGALARRRVDASSGAVLLTSRASYEMIDKAAIAGIRILAAISAPSALALRKADNAGMTLVGIARKDGFIVFCGGARLGSPSSETL